MSPDQLESLVTSRLSRLPAPRAPSTLLPRVLEEVNELQRTPRRTRPWFTWPRTWQAASLAALAALAWLAGSSTEHLAPGEARALVGAVRVLWEVFLEPNAAYLAMAAGALGATSALSCAALSRLLSERSPE